MFELQDIPLERLHAHAYEMAEALLRICASDPGEGIDVHAIAEEALLPLHAVENATANIAVTSGTDPEDMDDAAFAAFAIHVPDVATLQAWQTRRILRRNMYAYANSIHNAGKRDYAFAYIAYLVGRTSEPPRVSTISAMAAQAVRLRLTDVYEKTPALPDKPDTAPRNRGPEKKPCQDLLMILDPFTQPALL